MDKTHTHTYLVLLAFVFSFGSSSAQEKSKEQIAIKEEAQNFIAQGGEALSNGNFVEAEVDYRKAISINPKEEIGKYNLGNAYYNKSKNDEAMLRFKQAASIATNKPEKHKAFHNLGNTLMNAKNYQGAVEAYKNALRSNPTDEETRYNLALAKEMLEKNPPQGGEGDNDNKDQKDKDEKKENQDNKEKEGGDDEKEDNKDQGDQKEDKNKGDEEGDNEKPKDPKKEDKGEGEKPKDQKQQPIPGQMSPQQIKNLLDAMNNEEKKVQDKINVKKQKGAKVKSNKDW